MSRATKRKHVVRELLEERVLPAPRQSVVRVLGTPGNNLHEVETPQGSRFLASMPPRFRRHIWIKRGDFLLVDPIEEGSKVKAEISLVLLPPHIRFLQRQGLWPEAFAPLEPAEGRPSPEDAGLFVNTNRVAPGGDPGDSDSDSDSNSGTTGDGDSQDTGDSDTPGDQDAAGDTAGDEGDTAGDTAGDTVGDTAGEEGDTTGDTTGDPAGDTAGKEGDTTGDPAGDMAGDEGDTTGDPAGDTAGEEGDSAEDKRPRDSGDTAGDTPTGWAQ